METTLGMLLVLVAASLCVVSAKKPGFCREYDCPSYSSLSSPKEYNLRAYDESQWVGTSAVANSADGVVNGMFMKLFRYIGGDNTGNKKIPMTVPVITKVEALSGGKSRHTMMFYLKDASPPTATETGVDLVTLPAKTRYVKGFHTWFRMAGKDDYEAALDDLRADIGDSTKYVSAYYYTAGYASPWWPFKKYNEVWMDSA